MRVSEIFTWASKKMKMWGTIGCDQINRLSFIFDWLAPPLSPSSLKIPEEIMKAPLWQSVSCFGISVHGGEALQDSACSPFSHFLHLMMNAKTYIDYKFIM